MFLVKSTVLHSCKKGFRYMKHKTQYMQIVNYLEARICSGELVSGTKVPSLRKLAKEFDVSIGTIRRSFDYLRDKGILEMRSGSGVYVTECRGGESSEFAQNKLRISVFAVNDDLNNFYCAHALLGLQEAVGSKCTLITNFCEYNNVDCLPKDLLENAAAESDALVFLGCYDHVLKSLPSTKVCVGMEVHSSFNGVMSTVSLDPLNAAEMACNFFKEKGYKKVKVFYSSMPVYNFRMQVFCDLWEEYGIVEKHFLKGGVTDLSQLDDTDVAYYFTSDTEYNCFAHKYRKELDKVLVENRCVLSVDGKSVLLPNYEPINSISVDWKKMGKIVYEECIRRVSTPGSKSRRIYQNCFLNLYQP